MKNAAGDAAAIDASWSVWAQIWPYLLIAIVIAGVYGGTLDNGFVSDDTGSLQNPLNTDYHRLIDVFTKDIWGGSKTLNQVSSFYRPLPSVISIVVYSVAGPSAAAFHAMMIALHMAAAMLLFRLAETIFAGRKHSRIMALIAALVFAVHPINSESVCWISARGDVMMTVVVLSSLLLFAKQQGSPRGWQIVAHCGLFLTALWTKETGVVLPAIVIAFEFFYLRRRRGILANWPLYAGFTGTLGLYLAMRLHALGALAPRQGAMHSLGAKDVALSAVVLMAQYLRSLVVPMNFAHLPQFTATTSLGLAFIASVIALLATLAAMWWFRIREPIVTFALVFIMIPLLPAMNVNGLGDTVFGERYLYLSSTAFTLIAAAAWEWISGKDQRAAWAVTGVVLAIWTVQIERRIPDWHDNLKLATATAATFPNSATARTSLAYHQQEVGDNVHAVENYRASLALKADSAEVHNLLGMALGALGRHDEALAEFQQALALKPDLDGALCNIGVTHLILGQPAEKAEPYLARAVEINPSNMDAVQNLAEIRLQQRRFPEALTLLGRARTATNDSFHTLLVLGEVYNQMQDYRQAASVLQLALRKGAADSFAYLAHHRLGIAYKSVGMKQEASAEFTAALQLNGGFADSRAELDALRGANNIK